MENTVHHRITNGNNGRETMLEKVREISRTLAGISACRIKADYEIKAELEYAKYCAMYLPISVEDMLSAQREMLRKIMENIAAGASPIALYSEHDMQKLRDEVETLRARLDAVGEWCDE